jgi:tripartite-type tricarboxylate transporter receptor subunit TctC
VGKGNGILAKGLIILMFLALSGMFGPLKAEEKYPNRAINVIVPFTPGGSTNMMARTMAPFLKQKMGSSD